MYPGKMFFSIVVVSSWILPGSSQYAEELPQKYWHDLGAEDLRKTLNYKPNMGVAKNLVLLLGDGMGVSTVTAGRILKGQLAGRSGEEELLEMDKLPYSSLLKVYTLNAQTPDSGATATAFLGGVKAGLATTGVDGTVAYSDCSASLNANARVKSVLHLAHEAGKSTGIVVTSRVTHATPAGAYAHAPNRDWEVDSVIPTDAQTAGCKDIARQLIEDNSFIKVILGGGRAVLLTINDTDPEYNITGFRMDGRNLVEEWKNRTKGSKAHYVWRKEEFDQVDPAQTDYLLGLFEPSHMKFTLENDTAGEPTIAEMTEKAIKILSKNPKGFFLLVEGSRIDHGHHVSKAQYALHDLIAFDDAVAVARRELSSDDSLITVTADHSHTFTFGGYGPRGTPIFGLVPGFTFNNVTVELSNVLDKKPFTVIAYGNGPGYNLNERENLTNVNTEDKDYVQQSAIPLELETHSGEDVAVFAEGPMAHLFRGLHEQVFVAHVMKYAACLGEYKDNCTRSTLPPPPCPVGASYKSSGSLLMIFAACVLSLATKVLN